MDVLYWRTVQKQTPITVGIFCLGYQWRELIGGVIHSARAPLMVNSWALNVTKEIVTKLKNKLRSGQYWYAERHGPGDVVLSLHLRCYRLNEFNIMKLIPLGLAKQRRHSWMWKTNVPESWVQRSPECIQPSSSRACTKWICTYIFPPMQKNEKAEKLQTSRVFSLSLR